MGIINIIVLCKKALMIKNYLFSGYSKETYIMGKKSHRAKARRTANDGMNRSVVTWITIKSEGEEICEDDPNSLEIGNCSASAFFVEEFNVSSSSEKSSPEISNASMKYEPGTTTQDWRGPTVKMV
jgi:hypothetical protein